MKGTFCSNCGKPLPPPVKYNKSDNLDDSLKNPDPSSMCFRVTFDQGHKRDRNDLVRALDFSKYGYLHVHNSFKVAFCNVQCMKEGLPKVLERFTVDKV